MQWREHDGISKTTSVGLLAAAAVWLPVASASGQSIAFLWTGAGGDTSWDNPSNWATHDGGDVAGTPGLDDTAMFTEDTLVVGGAAGGIEVVSGVRVDFGGGPTSSTTVDGVILNNGEIGLFPDNTDTFPGVIDHRLFIPDFARLTGSGRVLLRGIGTGLEGSGASSLLINDAGHTITGRGTIRNLSLQNNGLIESVGGTLRVESASVSGTGTSAVVAGSVFSFEGGLFAQSVIRVDDGGVFDFAGETLRVERFEGTFEHQLGVFDIGFDEPGATTITGDYRQLSEAATLEIAIGGSELFDQLIVEGSAVLGGVLSIAALEGLNLSAGDSLLIVDIGGERTGTFAGLEEGSLIEGLGVDAFISFSGGDGNDVVLTVVPGPGPVAMMAVALGLASRRRR